MPFRRRRRKYARKRRFYGRKRFKRSKRRRRSSMNTSIIRAPGFMPDRLTTRHVAVGEIGILGDGLAVTFSKVLNANSCFSPFNDSIKCQGYTEMATLYSRYQVNGCSLKLNFTSDMAAPGRVTFFPSYESAIPGGLSSAEAQALPRSASRFFDKYTNHVTFKTYAKSSAILGRSMLQSNSVSGAIGSNPTIMWHWLIIWRWATPPAANTRVYGTYEMTQYTTWYKMPIIEATP